MMTRYSNPDFIAYYGNEHESEYDGGDRRDDDDDGSDLFDDDDDDDDSGVNDE